MSDRDWSDEEQQQQPHIVSVLQVGVGRLAMRSGQTFWKTLRATIFREPIPDLNIEGKPTRTACFPGSRPPKNPAGNGSGESAFQNA